MNNTDERRESWRLLLAEQRESGLPVIDWCYRNGISVGTFYYWRKRVGEDTAPASQWVAVDALTPAGSAAVTLRVGRVAVEVSAGFAPGLLGAVLGLLEARC